MLRNGVLTDVLRGSHRIIILGPSTNLMIIDRKQPRNEGDEINELIRALVAGRRHSEEHIRDRLESSENVSRRLFLTLACRTCSRNLGA